MSTKKQFQNVVKMQNIIQDLTVKNEELKDMVSRLEKLQFKPPVDKALTNQITFLREENARLWYMVGVAIKDPNTLRNNRVGVGMKPEYAKNQAQYGHAFTPFENND